MGYTSSTDRETYTTGEKWNLLDQAVRGAEQAVKRKTGFKIKLVEKRLYMHVLEYP